MDIRKQFCEDLVMQALSFVQFSNLASCKKTMMIRKILRAKDSFSNPLELEEALILILLREGIENFERINRKDYYTLIGELK